MGSFTITNDRNGYFRGSGSGPAGTLGESFTQLGSITPEGNVLFNVLAGSSTPTLLTFTGQVTGGPLTGQMALRTHEFSAYDPAFGPLGVASVVPDPSAWLFVAAGVAGMAAAARRLATSLSDMNTVTFRHVLQPGDVDGRLTGSAQEAAAFAHRIASPSVREPPRRSLVRSCGPIRRTW